MALLQISEPGGKPVRPSHRMAVGIDLGTTNSLVAASCGGKVETLPIEIEGGHLVPSVVHYAGGQEVIVGAAAQRELLTDPVNTFVSIKRAMGMSASEIASSRQFEHNELDPAGEAGSPRFITRAGNKDAVQISADILRALVVRTTESMGGEIEGVVITVPAYFNDAQRQQTRDAARLAGLNVLRLLNEPTAAAVAYGLDAEEQGTVMVFDLGGGTFDVSILKLEKGVFRVLATGGNTALGGDDFDAVLADWLREKAASQEGEQKPSSLLLKEIAKRCKHALTDSETTSADLNGFRVELDRSQFAELSSDLVSKTLLTCRRVLRDAGLAVSDLDNVVLVGGSTRMPVVREAVATFVGFEPLDQIDPDTVVAVGAGIQADVLIGNKSADDFLLLDVTPLSLGLETMGELVEKVIPRNTTIPVARAQEFTTFKDGQTAMSIHVVQGERELVSDCRSLARFELRGIPPMVAGAAKVRVTFQVDADGLLSVSAQELSTGVVSEIQVKPSYGLNADAIEQMLTSAHDHALEDKAARALRESQVEARQLADSLVNALQQDGGILSEQEQTELLSRAGSLEAAIAGASSDEIRELTEALNKLSSAFAARRMDLHIGRALRGESIESMVVEDEQGQASRKQPVDS